MPIFLRMTSLFMSFLLLLLPMVANCHFLHHQVKHRTIATTNHLQSFLYSNNNGNPRRHLSIPTAFLSIRGGSSSSSNEEREENDTNSEDDDDNFSADFVSSFESELMEIRQQAELEAEAELEKLRFMMEEGRGLVDDGGESDPDDSEVEEDDESAHENDEEDYTSNKVEPEEGNIKDNEQKSRGEQSAVEEETVVISDVGESEVEDEETKSISRAANNNSADHLGNKDEEGQESEKSEVAQSEDDLVVETDDSSVDEETGPAVEDSDSKKQVKPKRSKAKKSKSSKSTSKSSKSNRQLFDDIDSLSEQGLGTTVESVVLTRTVEVESRPRGISGFLQSDLVRALSLLIATIIVSVMMQRMQRQMEAQGL